MHQANYGKAVGVAAFLKACGANALFSSFDKGCPITLGKEREVVGVKVTPGGLLRTQVTPGAVARLGVVAS